MNNISLESLDKVADLYIRVSTTEQAEEGYSVGEQESRLKAYCEAYGYIINAIHIDPGYSGATLKRPAIQNLINDVRSGKCKKIIVWKLDRLSRSQKDTLILLEDVFIANNCDFVSIMESFDTSTPFGRCIVGILAAFAQMERENIRSRMLMGRQAGVKEGNYYAGRTPIGYIKVPSADGKKMLVPDPFTSQLVIEMYNKYAAGYSLNEIAAYLQNNYNWNNEKERQLLADKISRILRNPVYCGRVTFKDLICPGKHQELVSLQTWEAVNERLNKNAKAFQRMYSGSAGILSGLLFCGDCGARMHVRSWGWRDRNTQKVPKKYICYSVSGGQKRMVKDKNCTNRKKTYEISELDNMIFAEIKKLAMDPEAFNKISNDNKDNYVPEVSTCKERLQEIDKQINRLLNLYQSGIMGLEDLQDRITDLKNERENLEKRIKEDELLDNNKMSKDEALEKLASFADVVDGGDANALFDLVHALIDKIVILNEDIKIYWNF